MKTIYIICIACCLCSYSIWANENNKFEVSLKKSFFQGASDFASGALKAYSTMPDSKLAISIDNYGRVVDHFYWWVKRSLKAQFTPSKEFVKKNIKLIPAQFSKQKEDLVFLSYGIDKENIMIVQSGGLNARMMIFIYIPGKEKLQSVEQGSIRVENLLKKYFSKKFQSYIPGFTVKSTKGGYIATGKPIRPIKNLKYALCYMRANDNCISIKKMYFLDSLEPSVPAPNNWFSWLKEETKSRK